MREKKLSRLSRAELLELLLEQTVETERLQQKIEQLQQQLEDRNLKLSRAGDLAQAALAVNGVFEAAQATAGQYLENIAAMEKAAQVRCQQMLQEARQEADRIRQEAGTAETSENKE